MIIQKEGQFFLANKNSENILSANGELLLIIDIKDKDFRGRKYYEGYTILPKGIVTFAIPESIDYNRKKSKVLIYDDKNLKYYDISDLKSENEKGVITQEIISTIVGVTPILGDMVDTSERLENIFDALDSQLESSLTRNKSQIYYINSHDTVTVSYNANNINFNECNTLAIVLPFHNSYQETIDRLNTDDPFVSSINEDAFAFLLEASLNHIQKIPGDTVATGEQTLCYIHKNDILPPKNMKFPIKGKIATKIPKNIPFHDNSAEDLLKRFEETDYNFNEENLLEIISVSKYLLNKKEYLYGAYFAVSAYSLSLTSNQAKLYEAALNYLLYICDEGFSHNIKLMRRSKNSIKNFKMYYWEKDLKKKEELCSAKLEMSHEMYLNNSKSFSKNLKKEDNIKYYLNNTQNIAALSISLTIANSPYIYYGDCKKTEVMRLLLKLSKTLSILKAINDNRNEISLSENASSNLINLLECYKNSGIVFDISKDCKIQDVEGITSRFQNDNGMSIEKIITSLSPY